MNSTLPLEGRDLNPMLQDVGLIFHPPLLYLGYVGFCSVVLAFAVPPCWSIRSSLTGLCIVEAGVLLRGSFNCRDRLGILVGVLRIRLGGWWFWDPVEKCKLVALADIDRITAQQVLPKESSSC